MPAGVNRRLFVSILGSVAALSASGVVAEERAIGVGTPPPKGGVISSGPYATQPIPDDKLPDSYLSQKNASPPFQATDRITYRRY
jgi:hypothetical protein